MNSTRHERIRIGISGSYGGFNLGDEAILESIIRGFREKVRSEITVFSLDMLDTKQRYPLESAVAVRNLARGEVRREIEQLDFFILGGGGILYDSDARTFIREACIAEELGIPVMIYAVGAGPLDNTEAQKQVQACIDKADLITVRDRQTRRILESTGVRREIAVTADPAMLLSPQELPSETIIREGIDSSRALVGISVRERGSAAPDIQEERYHAILADSADFMIDRFGADVIFIPMERKYLDLQQCHAVIARMLRPQHARVLQGKYTPGQILSIINKLDFCVGMRLHFLIFSALQNIPFVGLPYSPKVHGFLEDMQLDMPPLHLVDAGRLIAHIDRAWDERKRLKEHIRNVLPVLQDRAQSNVNMALDLLRERFGPLPEP